MIQKFTFSKSSDEEDLHGTFENSFFLELEKKIYTIQIEVILPRIDTTVYAWNLHHSISFEGILNFIDSVSAQLSDSARGT